MRMKDCTKQKKQIYPKILTANIFYCFLFHDNRCLHHLCRIFWIKLPKIHTLFFKFWIYWLLCMSTNIDCFKTITVVSYLYNKNMAGLCIRNKNFTLLSNNQRSFFPVLHYELVAMNDFFIGLYFTKWYQVIVVQIRLYKMLTKINLRYFDHSHQFRMHYCRACMQNILIV